MIDSTRQQGAPMERSVMEETLNKNMKAVFTVIDRGQGKSIWVRVGVGFTNRDGSLNLKLDAIPVNGTLQVREWESGDRRLDAIDGRIDGPSHARPSGRDKAFDDPPASRLPGRDSAFDSVV
jgi:hypothetical protein